jgi:NAD(P)-dependent dehydrogenase (short-subunit alcohol dehydrogenase family)
MSDSPFSLKEKRILVTGASSGIGRQVAISANEAGAHVVITARDQNRLNETASLLSNANYSIIVCDLVDDDAISNQFAAMDNIDGVVHCAGLVSPFPTSFLQRKHVMETFNTNFIAPVLLTAFLQRKKKLNKESSLVFLSSISVDFPYEGGSMYSASKAAIEAYSRSLALELVKQKIRSNCIAPALIKTPMYENAEKNMINSSMSDLVVEKYLLGVGLPTDVSNLCTFLLSNAARWISGKKFTIDGGVLLSQAK